jgi:2-(1,2-epoxy-1,2-dihydrophenyl)acetyl-CoA isomerase
VTQRRETDGVLVERDGGLLVCTIDRPDRGGALRMDDTRALGDVFVEAADDETVRGVLLRSNGRHFCTGADLGGGAPDGDRPPTGQLLRTLTNGPHRLVQTIWDCPVPVVAAVQGRAAGLGLHLVLAVDIAVAAESATFNEPFVKRGFNVDSGGSFLLTHRVGLTRTMTMLLGSPVVDASDALAWGLVAEVAPDGELDARARRLAGELACGATTALRLTKALVHAHLSAALADAMGDEATAIELSTRSDDFKEGMRAFAGKRPPVFEGR